MREMWTGVKSTRVVRVWSVLMSLRQAKVRHVVHVLSDSLMMEKSVQVCGNDIYDPLW